MNEWMTLSSHRLTHYVWNFFYAAHLNEKPYKALSDVKLVQLFPGCVTQMMTGSDSQWRQTMATLQPLKIIRQIPSLRAKRCWSVVCCISCCKTNGSNFLKCLKGLTEKCHTHLTLMCMSNKRHISNTDSNWDMLLFSAQTLWGSIYPHLSTSILF